MTTPVIVLVALFLWSVVAGAVAHAVFNRYF